MRDGISTSTSFQLVYTGDYKEDSKRLHSWFFNGKMIKQGEHVYTS